MCLTIKSLNIQISKSGIWDGNGNRIIKIHWWRDSVSDRFVTDIHVSFGFVRISPLV